MSRSLTPRPTTPPTPDTPAGSRGPAQVKLNPVRGVALAFPCVLWYSVYMDDWVWALVGGAVTLAAAVVVVLWQAFKHLDLKIERLGERLDNKIDRLEDKVDKKFDEANKRFDQRFDEMNKRFDQRFDDMNKRFDDMNKKFDEMNKKFDQKFDEANKRFDQVMDRIADLSRLAAGHDAQIKAQAKETDRLSSTVFGPQWFSAPSQHHVGEQTPELAAPAEAASPGESMAASASGPEPTPPTAAIAQA